MCLGIPMKIIAIDQFMAHCEAKGIKREVSLFMLQHNLPTIGDYVVIHLSNAIEIISEEDALAAWEIYDEMLFLEKKELEKKELQN
ncbi:MAG: HypC/HybG/HupF family hydrogenase formation chaperone [Pseudomonadota bacterium]